MILALQTKHRFEQNLLTWSTVSAWTTKTCLNILCILLINILQWSYLYIFLQILPPSLPGHYSHPPGHFNISASGQRIYLVNKIIIVHKIHNESAQGGVVTQTWPTGTRFIPTQRKANNRKCAIYEHVHWLFARVNQERSRRCLLFTFKGKTQLY